MLALGLPDGERAKTAPVASDCWEALGEGGFTRSDAVVTFGGGATTDLGGFVAATWLRGRAGRARADDRARDGRRRRRRQDRHQHRRRQEPRRRLPRARRRAVRPRRCSRRCRATSSSPGSARSIKCGFIADPVILDLVEANDPATLTADSDVTRELIERAIRVKIDVVVGDLRETGGGDGHPGREVLNYGHTLAHAIERTSGYAVRHGEAVAIGSVYVAELAARAGVARSRAGRAAPRRLRARRPADVLRRRVLRGPARRDEDRQEVARQPAALRGARRPRPAPDPGRPVRGRPAGGVRRDREDAS